MISRVQTKELRRELTIAAHPKLMPMERGMLAWVILDPGDKVLDVNTTNGIALEHLYRNIECEVCGMSASMEAVQQSRARLRNADIVYAQADDIPWKENSFEAVVIRKKWQEADAWHKVLKETMRVLKPGGQLLAGALCYPTPIRQIANFLRNEHNEHDEQTHQAYESKTEVIQTLTEAGYQYVSWEQADFRAGVAIGWKPLPEPYQF